MARNVWAGRILAGVAAVLIGRGAARAAAPEPEINPFGPRAVGVREDAIPGALTYSDGSLLAGDLYITREKKLRGFVEKEGQHHLIPLGTVRRISTIVVKEWYEKHWRWLENANDAKVDTGRRYPVRMYEYEVTLKDGQTLRVKYFYDPIYIRLAPDKEPIRFILHHRDKGKLDQSLKQMHYIKRIEFGAEAKAAALKRLATQKAAPGPKTETAADRAAAGQEAKTEEGGPAEADSPGADKGERSAATQESP